GELLGMAVEARSQRLERAAEGRLDPERVGARLEALIAREEARFLERQPRSAELLQRASRSLAGGGASGWQIPPPPGVWRSHGGGSKVGDGDGTEYVDLHGGYGVMAVGHAHPAVVAAVAARVAKGTHFA